MTNKSKALDDAYRAMADALERVNQHDQYRSPLERIDLEVGVLRERYRESAPDAVQTLEENIEQARAFYQNGDVNMAILWVWYAGVQTATLINSEAKPLQDTQGASMRLMDLAERNLPAGKVLQKRARRRRMGAKDVVRECWKRCCQSVSEFRGWPAPQQRDHLLEHHAETCSGLKKDTVRSYCEEFAAEVVRENNG